MTKYHAQKPATASPDITQELELIYACMEIGGIAESSALYTNGLIKLIAEIGKPVEQLTVDELLQLHRQHKQFFNSLFEGGKK